jgi:thiamine-monophosphate kinase
MGKSENKKKSIEEFGKFGLINHLTRNVRAGNKTTITGIGDDSAVIDSGENLTLVSTDLLLICRLSATGCRIFYSKVPIDYETSRLAEVFNIDPMVPALNGGEDYEMLFTIPLELVDKIKMIQSVKVIGHMTSSGSGNYIVGDDGSEAEILA